MRVCSLVRRLLLVAVLVPVPLFVSARHDALGHRLRERDAPAPGLDVKQPRARAIEENAKGTVEEYQQYSWGYGYGYPPDEAEATSTEETSEEGTPATSKEAPSADGSSGGTRGTLAANNTSFMSGLTSGASKTFFSGSQSSTGPTEVTGSSGSPSENPDSSTTDGPYPPEMSETTSPAGNGIYPPQSSSKSALSNVFSGSSSSRSSSGPASISSSVELPEPSLTGLNSSATALPSQESTTDTSLSPFNNSTMSMSRPLGSITPGLMSPPVLSASAFPTWTATPSSISVTATPISGAISPPASSSLMSTLSVPSNATVPVGTPSTPGPSSEAIPSSFPPAQNATGISSAMTSASIPFNTTGGLTAPSSGTAAGEISGTILPDSSSTSSSEMVASSSGLANITVPGMSSQSATLSSVVSGSSSAVGTPPTTGNETASSQPLIPGIASTTRPSSSATLVSGSVAGSTAATGVSSSTIGTTKMIGSSTTGGAPFPSTNATITTSQSSGSRNTTDSPTLQPGSADNECNQQHQRGFRTCDVLLVAPFSHLEQYNDCDHRDGDHTNCASIAFQLNRDDHPTGINWYTTVVSTSELIISPWRPQHHDSLGAGIPDCERFSQPVQWHLGRSQQWRGGGRLILTQ
ncbi:Putative endo-beta-1,4-glucanase D [Verticillium dahliae VDG2]|nr:Putative endo-beta-1,4-glucanase D [Verticillium dahliae VDG2]